MEGSRDSNDAALSELGFSFWNCPPGSALLHPGLLHAAASRLGVWVIEWVLK